MTDTPGPVSASDLRGADLRGADLRGRDLSGLDLSGLDMNGIQLAGAALRGTVLHSSLLARADLRGVAAVGLLGRFATLEEAELADADLSGALLVGVTLLRARAAGIKLQGAELSRADLRLADLSGADLSGADLTGADLRGANLTGARVADVRARGAKLTGLVAEPAVLDALVQAGGASRVRSGLGAFWQRIRRLRARGGDQAMQRALAEEDLRGRDLTGADLRGAAWSGRDLRGARLHEARLHGADLRDAILIEVAAEAAVLRRANLAGIQARQARLPDADLRDADLSGADLSGADLSGADLRGSRLQGANLSGAILRGARLADLSLDGVNLSGALLDQADCSGVGWEGANVGGADIGGALGLGDAERDGLMRRGAVAGGQQALPEVSGRWVRAALGLVALGMAAYLAARFLAPGAVEPAHLETEAAALKETDPAAAAQRYDALADAAERPEDRVGYQLEAAALYQKGGVPAQAEAALRAAVEAAGDDASLGFRARKALAELLADQKRWPELKDVTTALLAMEGQPSAERALAIVLYEDACANTGAEPTLVQSLYDGLQLLPEAAAELLQAVADLRANRGQNEAALAALDRLAALSLPEETAARALGARARVLDRVGRTDEAEAAWRQLLASAAPGSLSAQSAALSLADLTRRKGDPGRALQQLAPVLGADADSRLRGRAMLLQAGLFEDQDKVVEASAVLREILGLGGLDADTVSEARLTLARLLLAGGDAEVAKTVLAGLPEEAARAVLAEARLGEGRRLLSEGEPEKARAIFLEIEAAGGGATMDPSVLRAARSGRAEALMALGLVQDAIGVWQGLLDQAPAGDERTTTQILLATALLQKGERDRAAVLFQELASGADPDAASQGKLGLASVARDAGEGARARGLLGEVAQTAVDPAWRVRAYAELADMALSEGRTDDALVAWRAQIGAVPPGHPAALEARLQIVGALEQAGRTDEARAACKAAISAAAGADRSTARVSCAELAERHQDVATAEALYRSAASEGPEEGRVEASLGLARLYLEQRRDPPAAVAALRAALDLGPAPRRQVALLALLSQAQDAAADLAGAEATRTLLATLAPQAPEDAAAAYADAASRARARGDAAAARRLLEAGLALGLPASDQANLQVDLGRALLDLGEVDEASATLRAAAGAAGGGSVTAFEAELGLAEVERRRGDPAAAVTRLRALTPPDPASRQSWLLALAEALSAARDPAAAGTWAELAGDQGAERSAALRGQAEAALQAGRPAEALPLFQQAGREATEASEQGWSALGEAGALRALKRGTEAEGTLRALAGHPDPEVALQAHIQLSGVYADEARWADALAALDGLDPAARGPAWHVAWTEAQARALVGAGRSQEAKAAWGAVATRWPGQEEAEQPAWLGQAWLALQANDPKEARELAERAKAAARDPGYRRIADDVLAALPK